MGAPMLLTWLIGLHVHFLLLRYSLQRSLQKGFHFLDCVQILFELRISCSSAFVNVACNNL
jgi:hypothetical protein